MNQVLQRKEKECGSLLGKCEDEQTLAGKLNTQIKELQARLDEIDEIRVSFYTGLGIEVPRLVTNLTDFFEENKKFLMILGKIWNFKVVLTKKHCFWGKLLHFIAIISSI